MSDCRWLTSRALPLPPCLLPLPPRAVFVLLSSCNTLQVLLRKDPDTGKTLEPVEELTCEMDETHSNTVISAILQRRGVLEHMEHIEHGRVRVVMASPSRGLIGIRTLFMSITHGTGIMHRVFRAYEPFKGPIDKVRLFIIFLPPPTLSRDAVLALASLTAG